MASACASCTTEIDNADAYFSDAGDMLCKTCFVQADTDQLLTRGEDEGNYYAEAESGASGWGSVGLGAVMLIGAIVWFVVGWMAGRIFFYPPVLGLLGLVSIGKGVLTITSRS